jgi:hypothetical protein
MKECLYCKKEFEPKKPKQLFCSDKHRTYFHRAKKRAVEQANKIVKAMEAVRLIELGEMASKTWDDLVGQLENFDLAYAKIQKEISQKTVSTKLYKQSEQCPERMEGESGIDYQLRLAEWKDKRKSE